MISLNPTMVFYRGLRVYCYVLFLILICCASPYGFAQQLAFPTAEGFGKNASGGRGGSVIKVTNLNNDGPGSLRASLTASGPRTIIFEVGGTISLTQNIYIENGNLTIAGQTAPGDGILLKGGMVQISASNVIIRNIRFRPGPSAPSGADALNITAWSGQNHENIIIDHCSLSWASDENFDVRALPNGSVTNVTIQNSIMAECGYGSLAAERTTKLSYHRNLYAHNSERNIRKGYPIPGTFDFELTNNLIYGFRYSTVPSLGAKFTVLNNKYKKSSQTTMYSESAVEGTPAGAGQNSQTYAYISGNILEPGMSQNNSALSSYLYSSPYLSSGIQPINANLLEDELLNNVGASLPARDAVDERLINQYNNGNGTLATSGVYPFISGGTALVDTDNDGMPDSWETANGLDINDPLDRNIVQSDGYTNLEYYLNGIILGNLVNQVNINTTNETLCQGSSTNLIASGAVSYLWESGETSATLEISPALTTTYTVTGTHSDGSTTEAEITITVNQIPTANAGEDIETCLGTPVTLTATGGTSYLWSNGATTASTTINPNNNTTLTVQVFENSCSSSDQVIVTVNEIPNVNAGEDQTIFDSESATLTATGADSYLWSTGETTESIIVNPQLDTSYSVTGTTSTCENTDTVTVFLLDDSVNANAGADTEICIGESTILTATGGTTYVWSTGETTATITVFPIEITTYTATVYSASGANFEEDSVIVIVNELPIANAGEDLEICFGNVTTLTASGGSSYLWSTGETTETITINPTVTTNYTVEVFENNCSNTDDVMVTVNDLPETNAGDDVSIIEGDSTTLAASGADSYVWSTGETTTNITVSPTNTTTYTVIGTNSDGCEYSDSVIVTTMTDDVTANVGDDFTICNGESTTLTASGGTTYLWNTGETTASIEVSPTTTTTYTVTAYSLSGNNTADDSVTVTVDELPIANAGDDVAICFGNVTTLTASGGSSYLWSTGETTEIITINPTVTTNYTVEVFENNCSNTDDVMVIVNDLPETNAGEDVSIIEGDSTTLAASGADSYVWSTGETTTNITVSPTNTTTYTVIGTNSDGCEFSDSVIVTTMTDDVTANAGDDFTICNGESTTLTASGGTTYLWNTGETSASIEVSPTTTTTYTVTAYSLSGNNTADDSVTVTVNELPIANAGDDVEICFGNVTNLTASGGTSYLWNTGETTQNITVNPTATTIYTVEVFENNCSSTDQTQVTVNALPETNAGTNVSIVEGDSTLLTASGANSYVWSTGETTTSITVSPASTTTYSVIGTNSNACESSDSVIVFVGEEVVNANAGPDITICNQENITLTATGGASYIWNTGETTASISVNPNQTTVYTVTAFNELETVSDDDSVTVTVNALPETNAGTNVSIIEGDSTLLTASGANSYVWSTGETTASITVSPTNTTTYTVTGNSNGCESSNNVIVSVETENINANAGVDVAICNGESTILTALGGVSYLWNTGETTATIEVFPTATTIYTVTAFSENGSESDDDSITVTVQEIPLANAGNNLTICFGNSTLLSASGGETYLWSTGETTQNITVNPNSTTTYTVEVFTNNCSSTDDVLITVSDLPQTNAGNDITILEGDTTTLNATGAASYIWSTGETTSSISVNPALTTTYTVTGIINGCESIDDVTVSIEQFFASAGADQMICQGYETTLTASDGDSYLWSTGEITQSITVNPTNTQTYTVTVFEGNNQADADVQVGVNPNPNVVIANSGDDVMILEGEFITLSASGANTYSWNNGATQPNIAVSPSITTTYEVTGFINNCEDTKAVVVNVLELVEADAGEDLIMCEEEIVTLTANGGDEYLWNNGETTQSIEVSPDVDTEYSVLVYNALDSDEDTVVVFVEACSTIENPIESETFDFLIYQDPTTDILKVKIDGLQSVSAKSFSIYNLDGKIIYSETFNPSEMQDLSQMTRELNVSMYSRGVYIVRLNYDDTSLLKKIPIR